MCEKFFGNGGQGSILLFQNVQGSVGMGASITISVNPGDHIYATSFGRHGENGHNSKDGIRVTFFSEYGVVRSLSPNDTYAEYLTNGYLTVPEGAVAANVPLWNGAANKEVYILNHDHCYENDVCLGCGSNAETGPA